MLIYLVNLDKMLHVHSTLRKTVSKEESSGQKRDEKVVRHFDENV